MPESPRLDEALEFGDNRESGCPCILLWDVSESMSDTPILSNSISRVSLPLETIGWGAV